MPRARATAAKKAAPKRAPKKVAKKAPAKKAPKKAAKAKKPAKKAAKKAAPKKKWTALPVTSFNRLTVWASFAHTFTKVQNYTILFSLPFPLSFLFISLSLHSYLASPFAKP